MGVAVFGDLPAASRKANVYEFDRAMQRKRFPKTLFGKSWGYFICLWFPVHAFFLFGRRRDRRWRQNASSHCKFGGHRTKVGCN